jgi:hypothetical protein
VAAGGLGTFIVHRCGTPLTIIASVYDPATQASCGAWIVTFVVSHRAFVQAEAPLDEEGTAKLHAMPIATDAGRNKPHKFFIAVGYGSIQAMCILTLTLFRGRGNRSNREVGVMQTVNDRSLKREPPLFAVARPGTACPPVSPRREDFVGPRGRRTRRSSGRARAARGLWRPARRTLAAGPWAMSPRRYSAQSERHVRPNGDTRRSSVASPKSGGSGATSRHAPPARTLPDASTTSR